MRFAAPLLLSVRVRSRIPTRGLRVLACCGAVVSCRGETRARPDPQDETALLPHLNRSPAAAPSADDTTPSLGVQIDPPSRAGDLQADIDGFTTVARCVETRAALDPLVGDALDALKYDTLLRDACRGLEAAKLRDERRCDAIEVSSLREGCRATVAEVASRPDACPWIVDGRPDRGRDPTCIAVASRDPRLCAAIGPSWGYERAVCQAVAGHDPAACRPLRSAVDAARCLRIAERWRALVLATPNDPVPARPLTASGALHVEMTPAGSSAPTVIDTDLGLDPGVARGVVVAVEAGALRFEIGSLAGDALEFVAPSPATPLRFGVAVRAALPAPKAGPAAAPEITVERVSIRLPGRAPLESVLARSSWKAKSARITAVRGAPVEVVLSGSIANAAEAVALRAEIHSFVRDVVSR